MLKTTCYPWCNMKEEAQNIVINNMRQHTILSTSQRYRRIKTKCMRKKTVHSISSWIKKKITTHPCYTLFDLTRQQHTSTELSITSTYICLLHTATIYYTKEQVTYIHMLMKRKKLFNNNNQPVAISWMQNIDKRRWGRKRERWQKKK